MMSLVAVIVGGLALLLSIVGSIWLLVIAFQESILWGLACLFLPFVQLIFIIMYFDRCKGPLLLLIGSVGLIIVMAFLGVLPALSQ